MRPPIWTQYVQSATVLLPIQRTSEHETYREISSQVRIRVGPSERRKTDDVECSLVESERGAEDRLLVVTGAVLRVQRGREHRELLRVPAVGVVDGHDDHIAEAVADPRVGLLDERAADVR